MKKTIDTCMQHALRKTKHNFISIMHCSVLLVHEGQQVNKGDIIGKVGMTGTATSPHLHFAVSYNGTPFNPQLILMQ